MPTSTRALLAAAVVLISVHVPATIAQDETGGRGAHAGDRMDWWRESRFGLFIHWGLYSIPAGEWDGQTGHAEWIMTTARIPVPVYETHLEQFNPVRFDADEWVRMAKDAGMRYIVITSKHHDGFCLFDSKHTDYDVMSTPFKRDILKELADACRREGIRLCFYHSIMDWHHRDYLPRRGWEDRSAEGADFERYVEHLRNQVTELLTNYGDIGVMWFDGEWESTWNHEYGQALYELCRELQPDVIVNNRVDKGRAGMAGMTRGAFAGDFGTPEQEIPETGTPGVDWESCMTMNRHWGYNKNDHDWKSARDLVRTLCDISSKGGNFLLNVGPTAEGTFPQEAVDRLRAIGDWMDVNSEAIYATQASPFEHLSWGRATVRAGHGDEPTTVYLHVFDWPTGGVLDVPGMGNEVVRAYLLTDRDKDLEVARGEGSIAIAVGGAAPDDYVSVIAMEIIGRPVVYETPKIAAASEMIVTPISVELSTRSGELEIRYTVDGSEPTIDSPLYDAPLSLADTAVVKARSFHEGRGVSATASARFERVLPWPAVEIASPAPGLRVQVYLGEWSTLPDFGDMDPARTFVANGIGVGDGVERVGRRYVGFIRVPADDVYEFALRSDDGSLLRIDHRIVVDNDGLHGPQDKRGIAPLGAGWHQITLDWFNKTGGADLDLRMAAVGWTLETIPLTRLGHTP